MNTKKQRKAKKNMMQISPARSSWFIRKFRVHLHAGSAFMHPCEESRQFLHARACIQHLHNCMCSACGCTFCPFRHVRMHTCLQVSSSSLRTRTRGQTDLSLGPGGICRSHTPKRHERGPIYEKHSSLIQAFGVTIKERITINS